MIKNIIFDVDGTLWDASEAVTKAWNAVYERRGLARRFTKEEVSSCMGLTIDEIEKRFFADTPPGESKRIIGDCIRTQNGYLAREGGRLYPGVKETLGELAESYGIYIVSNCECGYIETLLERAGIGPFVKDFLCAGMTGKGKGDNLLTLMKKNALENCVYVGDTLTDEIACREAGIPFIWAAYGFGRAERPAAAVKNIAEVREAAERIYAEKS